MAYSPANNRRKDDIFNSFQLIHCTLQLTCVKSTALSRETKSANFSMKTPQSKLFCCCGIPYKNQNEIAQSSTNISLWRETMPLYPPWKWNPNAPNQDWYSTSLDNYYPYPSFPLPDRSCREAWVTNKWMHISFHLRTEFFVYSSVQNSMCNFINIYLYCTAENYNRPQQTETQLVVVSQWIVIPYLFLP